MERLGRFDSQPPTSAEMIDVGDFLIQRYPDDWQLFLQRGLAHVRTRQLEQARADFKRAFEICPCFKTADWLALMSQLTDQTEEGAMANEFLAELLNDSADADVGLKRDLVTAFCRSPENGDYSPALQLAIRCAHMTNRPGAIGNLSESASNSSSDDLADPSKCERSRRPETRTTTQDAQ